MHRIFIACLTLITLSSCSKIVEYQQSSEILQEDNETNYVQGTNHIPLFKNLEIIKEESAEFDTISGNITIATYQGNIDIKKVKEFYNNTLPHIGFKNTSFEKRANSQIYEKWREIRGFIRAPK